MVGKLFVKVTRSIHPELSRLTVAVCLWIQNNCGPSEKQSPQVAQHTFPAAPESAGRDAQTLHLAMQGAFESARHISSPKPEFRTGSVPPCHPSVQSGTHHPRPAQHQPATNNQQI